MRIATLLAMAAVAALGFSAGFAYMRYERNHPPSVPTPAEDSFLAPAQLRFPTTSATWEPPSAGEYEVHSHGYYDFWFENRDSVPVELGISNQGCHCTELAVLLLSPTEVTAARCAALSRAASQLCAAAHGALGILSRGWDFQPFLLTGLAGDGRRVVALNENGSPISVPPGYSGTVCLLWRNKLGRPSTWRVAVELSARAPLLRRAVIHRLELAIKLVPVLRTNTEELNVGKLRKGEVKTAEFICWSSTRAAFVLRVRQDIGEVPCSWFPERLTSEERRQLAASTGTRALTGYRVKIAVCGGGTVGPFTDELAVAVGNERIQEAWVTVTGNVASSP